MPRSSHVEAREEARRRLAPLPGAQGRERAVADAGEGPERLLSAESVLDRARLVERDRPVRLALEEERGAAHARRVDDGVVAEAVEALEGAAPEDEEPPDREG